MTLLPLMQFIFDSSWPSPAGAVFMTPTKVWGPLSLGLLLAIVFSTWWIALIGLIITTFILWVDPKFYEHVDWKKEVKSNV